MTFGGPPCELQHNFTEPLSAFVLTSMYHEEPGSYSSIITSGYPVSLVKKQPSASWEHSDSGCSFIASLHA